MFRSINVCSRNIGFMNSAHNSCFYTYNYTSREIQAKIEYNKSRVYFIIIHKFIFCRIKKMIKNKTIMQYEQLQVICTISFLIQPLNWDRLLPGQVCATDGALPTTMAFICFSPAANCRDKDMRTNQITESIHKQLQLVGKPV